MAKKKDKHQHKTNAVRIVEAAGIPYEMHEYEAPEGFLDGVSVAKALGQEPGSVFKTLVTVGQSREYYVCEIPVDKELDLKKSSEAFRREKAGNASVQAFDSHHRLYQRRLFPGRDEERISDSYRCFCGAAGKNRRQRRESRTADGAAGESFAGNHGSLFCGSHRGQIIGRRAEYINCQIGEPDT